MNLQTNFKAFQIKMGHLYDYKTKLNYLICSICLYQCGFAGRCVFLQKWHLSVHFVAHKIFFFLSTVEWMEYLFIQMVIEKFLSSLELPSKWLWVLLNNPGFSEIAGYVLFFERWMPNSVTGIKWPHVKGTDLGADLFSVLSWWTWWLHVALFSQIFSVSAWRWTLMSHYSLFRFDWHWRIDNRSWFKSCLKTFI